MAITRLVILVGLCCLALVEAQETNCSPFLNYVCTPQERRNPNDPAKDLQEIVCNSQYGSIDQAKSISEIVTKLFESSSQYLVTSTYYSNYKRNWPGFQKLYRKLSDETWESALKLVQYNNKRGLSMDFSTLTETAATPSTHEHTDIQLLGLALDQQKGLADKIHILYDKTSKDADLSSYLQENYAGWLTSSIRNLAGHITDLKLMLKHFTSVEGGTTVAHDHKELRQLAIFHFDEYLQKVL